MLKLKRLTPIHLWPLYYLLGVTLLLSGCLTYLVYANYTQTVVKQQLNLERQEIVLTNELSHKFILVKDSSGYRAKMEQLKVVASQVNHGFPTAAALPQLLRQLQQLAAAANITLSSFLPQETRPVPVAGMVPQGDKIMAETVVLSGEANYLNLVNFVYQVAQLEWLIVIKSVDLTRIADGSVDFKCDLVINYRSELPS